MFRIRKASRPVDLDATLGPPLRLTDIEQSDKKSKDEEKNESLEDKENIDSMHKATPTFQPNPRSNSQQFKKPPISGTRVVTSILPTNPDRQPQAAVTHPCITPSNSHSNTQQPKHFNHQLSPRKPSLSSTSSKALPTEFCSGAFAKQEIIIDRKKYHKLSIIGRGGSSQVFKVLSHDGNLYALKEVYMKGFPPEIKQAYINEIRLLKKLKGNPQIITLHGCSWDPNEGVLKILLEHGEMDLGELIRSRRSSQPLRSNPLLLTFLWQQMLNSVKIIHDEGIIHNDLKPDNFVCSGLQLKLIDFGIANKIEDEHTSIERDIRCGTANYMAPECIMTHDSSDYFKIGRASDVWSLGCILYQMIYHVTPFDHIKGKMQKFHAITNPLVPVTIPNEPPVHQHPREIIELCLQRNPKSRPTIEQLLKHDFIAKYAI